jgi:hypothetical protein
MAAGGNIPMILANPSSINLPLIPSILPSSSETALIKSDAYQGLINNSNLTLYSIANATSAARTRYQLLQCISDWTIEDTQYYLSPFSKEKSIIENTILKQKQTAENKDNNK